MNKTGLVNEVKDRLGVSTAKARTMVDAVVGEIAAAVAQGEAITLRGFGFTPESDKTWAAATDSVSAPKKSGPARKTAARRSAPTPEPAAPTEPHLVPYEPMHDPVADALAAVAAEQSRPEMVAEPFDESTRVVPTMPEPELLAAPDTLAYSSGDANPDETIGERTADPS